MGLRVTGATGTSKTAPTWLVVVGAVVDGLLSREGSID